ncbi:hypothetical protein BACCAP_03883 [Pseudoflavonifractor capillosus ATCC 29799]|uniref:Uncharacterized protein n=1 Tax=Pseudoflavonifractor capillosus ATCC 29799 TaxID=411467 RepID=A6P075_9FIRM|nr:hypothetical protein BACCAP_03883 [Pseudoflavonifractor capillosus ATCC 29799]
MFTHLENIIALPLPILNRFLPPAVGLPKIFLPIQHSGPPAECRKAAVLYIEAVWVSYLVPKMRSPASAPAG